MLTNAKKCFDWSSRNLLTMLKQRRGYLLLVMCFVVLLFINLVAYSIFVIENGGWVFLMALSVLVTGGFIAAYGFPQTPGKRWVILASILLSIGSIPFAPRVFVVFPQHLIDRARFYVVRDEYLSKIEKAGLTNAPRFMRFPWGPAGIELVYDESDELSLPNQAKSEEWWRRVGKPSDFTGCEWQAKKVAQHFYVVSFYCAYTLKH